MAILSEKAGAHTLVWHVMKSKSKVHSKGLSRPPPYHVSLQIRELCRNSAELKRDSEAPNQLQLIVEAKKVLSPICSPPLYIVGNVFGFKALRAAWKTFEFLLLILKLSLDRSKGIN